MGLGVTPSDWSQGRAIEVLEKGYGFWNGTASSYVLANAYFNSGFKYGGTGQASHYYQYQGAHVWSTAASGTAGNAITFTQAMTLDASGNLGVGTTSPQAKIHTVDVASGNPARFQGGESNYTIRIVNSATPSGGSINANTGTAQGITISSDSGPMIFSAASSERMRLDSSGNLLVGTTTSVGKLTVSQATSNAVGANVTSTATTNSYCLDVASSAIAANCTLIRGFSNGSTQVFNVAGTGNVTNTNNSYGAISDFKLKENILDTTPKLSGLLQVRVVNYNLKTEPTHKQIGVIAQELETVFPAMVEESQDRDAEGNDLGTTTKSVKYSVFVPMLIKAIQEQQALITSLTARVAQLENK
jgi:hypothetical protein